MNSAELALRRFTTCVLESGAICRMPPSATAFAEGLQLLVYLERRHGTHTDEVHLTTTPAGAATFALTEAAVRAGDRQLV